MSAAPSGKNENIFLFFGIGEQRRAAARHKKDEKNSSAGAKMLVYYIIRNLMLIWRGKGQTNELWRISWQRRAETAFVGELPAGQDLALLSSLRRGGLGTKDAGASDGGGARV